jgi:glycosyltransferase involved in cell wall biosynthesis
VTVPAVSFVMPAYNAGAWIGAAISSVLTQSDHDVELVVVDDGSTDDTYAIAEGFGDRITLVHQDNAGLSAARNVAIQHCAGDFIGLCDSDDILLPNYVAAVRETLASAPGRTWVTSRSVALTDDGLEEFQSFPFGEIGRDGQRQAILQGNFVSIFSVFPRAMVDEIGVFDEALRRCEDWEYWARAIHSGWRVAFQPKVAACYRRQGSGLSANTEAMLAAEALMFDSIEARFSTGFTAQERALLSFRSEHGSPLRLRAEARARWRGGEYAGAAEQLAQAAIGLPVDGSLKLKATAAKVAAPALAAAARILGRGRHE